MEEEELNQSINNFLKEVIVKGGTSTIDLISNLLHKLINKKTKKDIQDLDIQMLLISKKKRSRIKRILRKQYYHNMINNYKIGIYPQSKLIIPEWASKMIDKFYKPEMEKIKYFKWTEINKSGY